MLKKQAWNELDNNINVHDGIFLQAIFEVVVYYENNPCIELSRSHNKVVHVSLPVLRRLSELAMQGLTDRKDTQEMIRNLDYFKKN